MRSGDEGYDCFPTVQMDWNQALGKVVVVVVVMCVFVCVYIYITNGIVVVVVSWFAKDNWFNLFNFLCSTKITRLVRSILDFV
jgi:hypothetical protein